MSWDIHGNAMRLSNNFENYYDNIIMHDYSSDKENYSLRVSSSVNVEIERPSFVLMGRPNDEHLAEVKMLKSWINCLFMGRGWWYRS